MNPETNEDKHQASGRAKVKAPTFPQAETELIPEPGTGAGMYRQNPDPSTNKTNYPGLTESGS